MYWDFGIFPNATDEPHVGHLWITLNSRSLYCNMLRRSWVKNWTLRPKWGIIFDVNAIPQYAQMYIDMLKWLNCEPEFVVYLKDLIGCNQDNFYGILNTALGISNKHGLSDRGDGVDVHRMSYQILKLFVLQSFYWHIRGCDMRSLRKEEEKIVSFARLHYPKMIYVPLLCDTQKKKIGDGEVATEYQIRHLIDKTSPDAAVRSLENLNLAKEDNRILRKKRSQIEVDDMQKVGANLKKWQEVEICRSLMWVYGMYANLDNPMFIQHPFVFPWSLPTGSIPTTLAAQIDIIVKKNWLNKDLN